MIVHYLSSSTLPSRAANSVHVMKIAGATRALGHEIVVFARPGTPTGGDLFDEYGVDDRFDIEYASAPSVPVVGSWVYAIQVGRMSRRLPKPDVYWARNLQSLVALARRPVPLVYESHSPPASAYHDRLERFVFGRPNFSHLVVISGALADDYRRRHGEALNEKIVVAPDGADALRPGLAAVPLPGRRADALQVGYTGHLYAGRGVELMLAAAAQCPDMDFHFVGGTEPDIERWQSVASDVPNANFHGHRSAAQIPALLLGCDVVLAPYQRRVETAGGGGDTSGWMSPLKIFEYMAAGRAVVASDLPVLSEVLDDQNAVLCDPENVGEWVEALRTLAADESRRHALGAAARERFEGSFTWRSRAEHVLAVVAATPTR